jgi:hypothetical protein
MGTLDDLRAEADHEIRLAGDLAYFAGEVLKIRTKAGPLAALTFNPAQIELHRKLEEQKQRTGKVRAIVLKARQMGVSTYVAARLYRQTIGGAGLRTFIIGHEKRASSNLYQLVRRFHDNLPDDMRPSVSTSNAEELTFDRLDSGYIVQTATAEGAGRSATAQLLHGSEVAFWANLAEQTASLLQTTPNLPGTEVIFESTADAFGSPFHQMWRAAEAGDSPFEPVFLPWSIEPAYRMEVPEGFDLTSDERELARLHGLDDQQIVWRRMKISELRSEDLFRREYPLTPSEAFVAANFDSYIPADLVMRARKEEIEPYGPLLIGCDPAGQGDDSTVIAWRQGHRIIKTEKRKGLTTMEIAGRLSQLIRDEKPAKVSIDVGGLGIGVAERLEEQGHGDVVNKVNFGSKPVEPPPLDEMGRPGGGPLNRRAELYQNLKKALEGRIQIPDDDALMADLVSVGYTYDSQGRLQLESKKDMRRRGMPSPDLADAVALCFSEPEGSPFPRSNGFNRKIDYPGFAYA